MYLKSLRGWLSQFIAKVAKHVKLQKCKNVNKNKNMKGHLVVNGSLLVGNEGAVIIYVVSIYLILGEANQKEECKLESILSISIHCFEVLTILSLFPGLVRPSIAWKLCESNFMV